MPCNLVSVNQGACPEVDGGIFEAFAVAYSDITGVTVGTGNQITAITLEVGAEWAHYVFDRDNTGSYNQNSDRQGKRHNFTQVGFMKFAGLTAAKLEAANDLPDCCETVWIYFINNQFLGLVQGLQIVGGTVTTAKKPAVPDVNILTDTDDNEDRIEITINSTAKKSSPHTTLTRDDLIV